MPPFFLANLPLSPSLPQPETYIDTVSMSGPTQIAQWAGGTFSVDSIITTPFDTFTVEVYSPNDVHVSSALAFLGWIGGYAHAYVNTSINLNMKE